MRRRKQMRNGIEVVRTHIVPKAGMIRTVVCYALVATLFSGPARAGAVPADPAPFVGNWAVAWPETSGVVVNTPDATCAAPVVIEILEDNRIVYRSPSGAVAEFEVMSFAGRFPWWSDQGRNGVAEWIDFEDNEFLLAFTELTGGTDWSQAKQYSRCP